MNAPLTLATLFSGIGAPEAALGPLGFAPLFSAEIEKFPAAVLAHHHPDMPNLGDVTADDFIARCAEFGRPDMLVAGSPCQAFSLAGKRASLGDARGNLTLRTVEIVHAIRPRLFLWENVPGVLSTRDNAFGCFLAGIVGASDPFCHTDGKWPRAGMVAGPRARAAWRVCDAQYFGLAQRRKRVFLVADFGDGGDPAQILFERKSLQGNSPPRREAGQSVAGTLEARAGTGGYDPGAHGAASGHLIAAPCRAENHHADQIGYESHLIAGAISASYGATGATADEAASGCFVAETECFGGGNCGGPIEVGTTLTAKGQRIDFEVETFVAHTLREAGFDASEDGTGRGTPLMASCVPVAGSPLPASCIPINTQLAMRHKALGRQTGLGIGEDGDPAFTLQANHCHAIAFDARQDPVSGDIAGARGSAHPQAQAVCMAVCMAVSVSLRGRDGGGQIEVGGEVAAALRAAQGGSDKPHVLAESAVRRLMPIECERLQGFEDNYTRISWRGKPPEQCPDGPRYKALGNSMAVPVIAWIGARAAQALTQPYDGWKPLTAPGAKL